MTSRKDSPLWSEPTVPDCGLPRDESHSPVLVVGGAACGAGGAVAAGRRSRGRGFGAGACPAAAVGAATGGAAGRPPLSRSAGSRLTLLTIVAGGPTGGAIELPTLMRRASGLPVLSTGAAAVGGTA